MDQVWNETTGETILDILANLKKISRLLEYNSLEKTKYMSGKELRQGFWAMRPWAGQVENWKFSISPPLLYFYDSTHRGGLHNVRESG